MTTILLLIISILLAYFFPQFKLTFLNRFFAKIIDFFIKKIEDNVSIQLSILITSLFIFVLICFSFIIPSFIFLYTKNFVTFIIEVFVAFHLISIPSIDIFMQKGTKNISENSATIIQSIVYFVDYFFIPCLCIALLGIPTALLFRLISYCAKRVSFSGKLHIISNIHNGLYFIPSFSIVLSLFTVSLFLPFCNGRNAYEVYLKDRRAIEPYWLSRILSTCFGLLCIEIPVSYMKNGTVKTCNIGNTNSFITFENVKSLLYILYSSSSLTLLLTIVFNSIVMWGLW